MVAGLVGEGLTRIFVSSGLDAWRKNAAQSTGRWKSFVQEASFSSKESADLAGQGWTGHRKVSSPSKLPKRAAR